jgi:prepilin-type N-terminal cleavage/methylation domain-containing protein
MKTYRAGNLNKPAGFTLLELVVVMLIVATMLGLVLPGTSWFFMRSDLKTSSRRLAGVVAEARSQAMLERRVQELTMDLDNGVFWTSAAGDSDKSDFEPTRKHALEGEVRFMDVRKSDDEQRSSGQVALRFQPKGLTEPAVIHLAGSGERVQTLIVKPFSGRCVIQDGYIE